MPAPLLQEVTVHQFLDPPLHFSCGGTELAHWAMLAWASFIVCCKFLGECINERIWKKWQKNEKL